MAKKAVNGTEREVSQFIDLTQWTKAEPVGAPKTLEEIERLVEVLEFENAQVVEVVAVMNAATRLADELRSALTTVLGPKVLGSQSDVVWSRLYGEDGMAVIAQARALAARPAPGGTG